MPLPGGFNACLGPMFRRDGDGRVQFAIRVEERHLNIVGVAHGGFLATVADVALYRAYAAGDNRGITVSLNLNYVDVAREGDWLELDVQVQRSGRTLAFANANLRVGDRAVGHVSAVFRTY